MASEGQKAKGKGERHAWHDRINIYDALRNKCSCSPAAWGSQKSMFEHPAETSRWIIDGLD